jgi:hypothetical protein
LISPRPLLPSPPMTTTTLSTPPSLFALIIYILYIILCSLLGGGAVRVIDFFDLVLCDFDLGPPIPTKKQPRNIITACRGGSGSDGVSEKTCLSLLRNSYIDTLACHPRRSLAIFDMDGTDS